MNRTEQWVDVTRSHIRDLQDILLAVSKAGLDAGASSEGLEAMLAPYRDLIESVYERDMALSRLVDKSDLLLHLHGPAASAPAPRVSVLTKMLTQTRDQVTRLAKHLGGVTSLHVPAALDMGLVGFASGSLFIGFSAGNDETSSLSRDAVNAIGVASGLVAADAPFADFASELSDPATRDMAVTAVRHLSPSGQIGIREVEVFGRQMTRAVTLSTDTRRAAKKLLSESPKVASPRVTFIGTVREADLDAARFEIRNVDGHSEVIRCAHELLEEEVQALMNQRVRVSGVPEYGARGTVRLLWVDSAEKVDDAT